MEESVTTQTPPVCSYCHQPVLSSYYFCPNCGTKLSLDPLSTSIEAQVLLYAFSITLPLICFIFVSKWSGLKYYRSSDEKTKTIGTIAFLILIISTLVTIWLAYAWTQEVINSLNKSISMDLGI